MSEIKLVLTDIDGTLVQHGKDNPTIAVRESINAVQDAGVELTAATGRPYEMMRPLFEKLGFRDLGIFDAGASIRDIQTGELVWSNWLETERIRRIAEVLLPHCVEIDFFPTFRQIPPEEATLDDTIEPAPYVWAFVRTDARSTVLRKISALPRLSFHEGPGVSDRPGVFDIQITDVNSDKFHAVNALRQFVHSEKRQTLAIGDSSNDIPLFKNADTRVAMGNATEELKKEATHIVGTVDQDGFAEAMQRFVLRK